MEGEWITGPDELPGRRLKLNDRFFYLNPSSGQVNMIAVTQGGNYPETARVEISEDIGDPSSFDPAPRKSGWGVGGFGSGPYGGRQKHDLKANDLTVGSPELGRPELGQAHNLRANDLVIGQHDRLEAEPGEFRVTGGDAQATVNRTLHAEPGRFQDLRGAGEIRLDGSANLEVVRPPRSDAGIKRAGQIARIKQYAPYTVSLVEEVIEATEQKKLNSPEARAALDNLIALRDELNKIIAAAEAGKPVKRFLKAASFLTKPVGEGIQLGIKHAVSLTLLWALAYGLKEAGVPLDAAFTQALREMP